MSFAGGVQPAQPAAQPSPAPPTRSAESQSTPFARASWWEQWQSHTTTAQSTQDLLRSAAPGHSRRGKLKEGVHASTELIMQRVRDLVGQSYADSSQGVIASAMSGWGKFTRAFPDRDMIRTPAFSGDLDVSIHNEISIMMCGAWMLGNDLAVSTIATYLSLIRTNLGAHLGWRLTCPQSELRLPRFLRGLRRQKMRVRRRRVGWRAHHHRQLRAATGMPVAPLALVQDAILTATRQGLLRPCEAAVSSGDFDPSKHLTVGDVEFFDEHDGYLILTILPAKKPPGQPKDEPVLYPSGDGIVDFYSACARMLEERRSRAPGGVLDPSAPLFLNPGTRRAFTTTELRALYRGVARAIGLDPHPGFTFTVNLRICNELQAKCDS